MRLFGTDGVRGIANIDLTPELAARLGRAAGTWLRSVEQGRPGVIVGRDTRRSGPMLGAALASGLCSAGVDVLSIGVAPTPAVSFAVRTCEPRMGAVISASHNPADDNGIKFLGADGRKLSDEAERQIEDLVECKPCVSGSEIGRLTQDSTHLGRYRDWLFDQLPERLEGFRVVVDCANGAASGLAGEVLRGLGADVIEYACSPDGDNINLDCGATRPSLILQATVDAGASLGIAFDGDADRCVFGDERGALINGDRAMGIWAAHQSAWGGFEPPVVVGTVMSNMGFEKALESAGIRLERTAVGDRYVAERMQQTGAKIGGEQSGHIIFSDLTPTGDGLLTALQILRVMRQSGCAASELPPVFDNWPQQLINVRVKDRSAWDNSETKNETERMAAELNGIGRVVVRPSGTQPMIRVMVEAQNEVMRDELTDRIVGMIERELGGEVYGRVDLTNALGD